MDFSIINYYGNQISKCGYCKGLECSVAHGMHAYKMLPQDYQDLIDRGWRRSGHYCYKPYNKTTCCPCYTIKCDALEFKPTKSHKKILKRMNRFLRDGKKDQNEIDATNNQDTNSNAATDDGVGGIREEPTAPNMPLHNVDLDAVMAANPKLHTEQIVEIAGKFISPKSEARQIDEICSDSLTSSGSLVGSKKSYDSSKPPCKKAKQMRLERKQAKLIAKGIDPATVAKQQAAVNAEKTISDYISDASDSDKHTLKVVLVPSNGQQVTEEAFNLYRKYQLTIHNDNPQRLTTASLQRFCYKSPLQHVKTHDGPDVGYGSFHQQYWLDDKLIAVAVIDILPYCVSSVYFFYDPDYSFLSLGTYGSLREINFVQELATNCPALKYYYMGFYVHSCPKMRYKGKLLPSYLLCPETYNWNLLNDEIRSKLDENKYQRLHANDAAKDEDDFLENHLDAVLLLTEENIVVTYREYIQITGEDDDRESILEYGRLVGRTCAHRMLYLKT